MAPVAGNVMFVVVSGTGLLVKMCVRMSVGTVAVLFSMIVVTSEIVGGKVVVRLAFAPMSVAISVVNAHAVTAVMFDEAFLVVLLSVEIFVGVSFS